MQFGQSKAKLLHSQPLRLAGLTGLLCALGWIFLSPSPLPFNIEIQRELGYVGHVGAFAVVTLSLLALFPTQQRRPVLFMFGAAIVLEAAQFLIPTRGADVMDFVMNCLGIILGACVFRLFERWQGYK